MQDALHDRGYAVGQARTQFKICVTNEPRMRPFN
jgi:hypothetical protein